VERKFLNPSQKAKKYAQELRSKKRLCNDLTTVKNEPLTSNGASWRMGYLAARKDATEVWKANKEKFATVPVAKTNKRKGTNNIPRKLDKYEVENSKKDAMDGMDRL